MRKVSILLFAVVFLTASVALAEEPAPKAEKKKKADEEEVLTFTTEDLERKYGPSVKTPPKPKADAKGEAKPLGPLEQLQASQQAAREKAAQRDQARARVQAAQARIAELEKRQAQLRNPLLGPVAPEEGEREAWEAADQAGRIRLVENSLAAARRELDAAIEELARLR